MNDNTIPEGPNHAAALALLNDLMLILANASKAGLERYDSNGEAVFDFSFWSNECAKVVGVRAAA